LNLIEILKLGMVDRKLYIKSGDVKMLRANFMRRNHGIQQGLASSPIPSPNLV